VSEVPGSAVTELTEPNMPRLFDAACLLMVVWQISPQIDTRPNQMPWFRLRQMAKKRRDTEVRPKQSVCSAFFHTG
jgi:hypothetical protein